MSNPSSVTEAVREIQDAIRFAAEELQWLHPVSTAINVLDDARVKLDALAAQTNTEKETPCVEQARIASDAEKYKELAKDAAQVIQEVLRVAKRQEPDPEAADEIVQRAEWHWKRINAPIESICLMADVQRGRVNELEEKLAEAGVIHKTEEKE